MKQAATALDVEAVRVTFALEAEEWFVEQFADLRYGKAYLEKYLGHPLDRLLTGDDREKLQKHLDEVRKVRGPGAPPERADGKPRNVRGFPAPPTDTPSLVQPMPGRLPPNVTRDQ